MAELNCFDGDSFSSVTGKKRKHLKKIKRVKSKPKPGGYAKNGEWIPVKGKAEQDMQSEAIIEKMASVEGETKKDINLVAILLIVGVIAAISLHKTIK